MEENRSKNLLAQFIYRIRKERISFNNFVLTDMNYVLLLTIPMFITFIQIVLFPSVTYVETGSIGFVNEFITDLIRTAKLGAIFITVYVLMFKFSRAQDEGIYGYWLALGVNRDRFLLYTITFITLVSGLGIYLSIIIPTLFLAISISVADALVLLSLVLVSQLFLVSLILVLVELIEWAEIAFIAVIVPYFMVNSFVDPTTLPGSIFFSELTFLSDTWFLPLLVQIVSSIVMISIAYRMHLVKDMELGG